MPYGVLLEQKWIIDYESMSIRLGGGVFRGVSHYLDNDSDDRDNTVVNAFQYKRPNQCWIHNSDKHKIGTCRAYLEREPEDRVKLVKENRACYSCLKIGHRSSDCKLRMKCDEEGCEMYHHKTLHEAHTAGVVFHSVRGQNPHFNSENRKQTGPCLLSLMAIPSDSVPEKQVNVLWDSGATLSLITFNKAKQLKLIGEEVKISVVKVGGEKQTLSSCVYDLPLRNKL